MKRLLLLLFVLCSGSVIAQSQEWTVSLHGGGTYLLGTRKKLLHNVQGSGADEYFLPDFVSDYRTGWLGSAEAHFWLARYFGLGLKYSALTTSGDLSFNNKSAFLTDKVFMHYIAPSFVFRAFIDDNVALSLKLSAGYVLFKREFLYGGAVLASRHHDVLGTHDELSLDYFLTPNISIGFSAGYFASTRHTGMTFWGAGEPMEPVHWLQTISYSIGINYYFTFLK